jgi:hypothetical protein
VSRQGIAFDYSSPAELYLSRRRRRPTDYRRFATAAEAIRYAFEELRTRRSRSAWMQVGDEFFNKNEINRLYYPMSESLSAAPVRPHETDVSTRLSVRIDLASGGHLGSGKIALLEAIQEQKSISGAARSLGMPCLKAQRCLAAPPFVSASGPRGTGQGIGDWPLFLVKYRLAYANENNGDYIVTAFFQMSSPSGTGDAISNNVLVAQPTLAFGVISTSSRRSACKSRWIQSARGPQPARCSEISAIRYSGIRPSNIISCAISGPNWRSITKPGRTEYMPA